MTSFEEYLNKYINSDDKENDNDNNEILKEPLVELIENCGYYDMSNLPNCITQNNYFHYKALHLSIVYQVLKYDQLVSLLSQFDEICIKPDFIMLCETILNNVNYDKYDIILSNLIGRLVKEGALVYMLKCISIYIE